MCSTDILSQDIPPSVDNLGKLTLSRSSLEMFTTLNPTLEICERVLLTE